MSRAKLARLLPALLAVACTPRTEPASAVAPAAPTSGPAAAVARAMAHDGYDGLLRAHVSETGVVDYRALATPAARAVLTRYLDSVAGPDPAGLNPDQQKALWINVYNAATLDGVLAAATARSVKDIPEFWQVPRVTVGGVRRSLDDIEHRILRPLGDPRIHVSVNCASRSCPRLWHRAFRAESLDADLDTLTRAFLADPDRNRFDDQGAQLSQIFEWFAADFAVAPYGSVRGFLRAFGPAGKVPKDEFPLRYLAYDWSLNGTR